MQRIQYTIQGMSCAACVAHVERVVRGVLGDEGNFTVSLLTNSVSIVFEAELDGREKERLEAQLSAAIHAAGYRLLIEPPRADAEKRERRGRLIRLICSAVLTLILMYVAMGHMLSLPLPSFLSGTDHALAFALTQLLLTVPVIVLNFKFFRNGFSALLHMAPNMDSLIALGSGASLIYGMIAIVLIWRADGNPTLIHPLLHDLYFESAAMILTLVSLGKLLESRAKDKASDAVRSLARLTPQYAAVLRDGKEVALPLEELSVGDLILVRAGELIPVDGEVTDGTGSADESALTGESMPVDKERGSTVSAACVLTSGALTVRATRVGKDTSLSRLIQLLEDAASSKAPIARIADRVSAVFVPCVMGISLLTFVLWMLLTQNAEQALRSAIAVLVISCPCALGLATPTAITVGVGRGARNGILFRSAESLEKLCSVKTVVFDKTGTVTEGTPALSELYAYGIEARELLALCASVERFSKHPLAIAVQKAAEANGIEYAAAEDFEGLVGIGAQAVIDGQLIRVGKPDAALRARIAEAKLSGNIDETPIEELRGTAVFYRTDDPEAERLICDFIALEQAGKTAAVVMRDGDTIGLLGISDRIRHDSPAAIAALQQAGVHCLMLTGDNERTAAHVAQTVGLSDFKAGLLPEEKEAAVALLSKTRSVAMVGDGINDAPALARADVGIAIGAGTEIAIESADVVLSQNSLTDVYGAYRLSLATLRIIKQNLFWALFYNAICIPVAAGVFYPVNGWQLSPMLASAAMSCSSIFVVSNALRLYRVPLHQKSASSQTEMSKKGESSDMLFGKKAKAEPVTYVIGVEGMMCPRCVAHVKSALEAVPGVTSVDVSLEQKNATVTATASRSALTEAITKAGYEVVDD